MSWWECACKPSSSSSDFRCSLFLVRGSPKQLEPQLCLVGPDQSEFFLLAVGLLIVAGDDDDDDDGDNHGDDHGDNGQ